MLVDPWFFDRVGNNVVEINGELYSMILKNGTTSIENVVGDRGFGLKQWWEENVGSSISDEPDEPVVVNIIWRDPLDRYFSALRTTKVITEAAGTNLDCQTMDRVERNSPYNNTGWYLDPHMFPQYWYVIQAYILCNCSDKLYFRFIPIDNLDDILGVETRENVSPPDDKKSSATERKIIKERYTIDMRIWHHALHKTLNYNEFMDLIVAHGGDKMPRYTQYYEKTHPRHNVENYKEIVQTFNENLEKIEEIAKKSKI
jgi:hypothetical protein